MGGGGGGKPQNIFKLDRGIDPPEAFNWRLYFAVFSFGIMGAARGMRCFMLRNIFIIILVVIVIIVIIFENQKKEKKYFHFAPQTETALYV